MDVGYHPAHLQCLGLITEYARSSRLSIPNEHLCVWNAIHEGFDASKTILVVVRFRKNFATPTQATS
jgi:hypothetical protein